MAHRESTRSTPPGARIPLGFLCIACLIGWLATPLAAQRSIVVVDSYGRPVPAVRIDVFGTGELITVQTTSEDGVANLDLDRWSDVRRLSLSHLGFNTLIVQAADIPADGVIQLQPEAVALEGLSVVGRELCPVEGAPEARELWSTVAALYSQETDGRALSAFSGRRAGPVPETELFRPARGQVRDYVVAWSGGVRDGSDPRDRPLSAMVLAEGYAWEPIEFGGIRDPGEWRYAELHHAAASHFASPAFGDLHDFAIAGESGDGVATLVFCPREGVRGATLRGVLRVRPGEELLSAEWRFATTERDEGAGGSVDFYAHPENGDAQPHLMAAKGVFFRHNGRPPLFPELPRTYSRESIEVAGWTVHPTGSHPCSADGSRQDSPGVGLFKIYSARPETPEGREFLACVLENWGAGAR